MRDRVAYFFGLPARVTAFLAALLLLTGPAVASSLADQPKYAAIVIDTTNGEVLYERRADVSRYPASITKVMTLYLAFDALEAGTLKLSDPVFISRAAASQPPSKLGIPVGESLSVEEAIRVIAVKSANDIAVALAEKIAGSEANFAERMTLKARQLGMMNTRFRNASGLPDPEHRTTARDIALLSMAVLRNHPKYYSYFGQQVLPYGQRSLKNHNRLLGKVFGVDGIKTGYTRAAGFTLAASALREGRRVVTVVLGGPSTVARDGNVTALFEAAFSVLRGRPLGLTTTVAQLLNEIDEDPRFDAIGALIEQGSAEAPLPQGSTGALPPQGSIEAPLH